MLINPGTMPDVLPDVLRQLYARSTMDNLLNRSLALKTSDRFKHLAKRVINPAAKSSLSYQVNSDLLPTLWLVGKTGAGKSSLVQAVTGDTSAEIGLGFKPCTASSQSYDFPEEKPLFRFLDTRGLGEAHYSAQADIDVCQSKSSAIVIIMKLDDPEQSSVIGALQQVKKAGAKLPVLVIHTGQDLLANEADILRCQQHNQEQVEAIVGACPHAVVNFYDLANTKALLPLYELLAEQLPLLNISLHRTQANDQEAQSFASLKNEVLWYAGVAGGSDILPVVGLVSVPSLQAKMIHSLAQQYGIAWGKREYGEFIATLGTSFGVQYSARLGVRQLAKLIPGYGQTIGAASAAALSFSSTYALGRVAAKYLYHKARHEEVSQADLTAIYKAALTMSQEVAKNVENNREG